MKFTFHCNMYQLVYDILVEVWDEILQVMMIIVLKIQIAICIVQNEISKINIV